MDVEAAAELELDLVLLEEVALVDADVLAVVGAPTEALVEEAALVDDAAFVDELVLPVARAPEPAPPVQAAVTVLVTVCVTVCVG